MTSEHKTPRLKPLKETKSPRDQPQPQPQPKPQQQLHQETKAKNLFKEKSKAKIDLNYNENPEQKLAVTQAPAVVVRGKDKATLKEKMQRMQKAKSLLPPIESRLETSFPEDRERERDRDRWNVVISSYRVIFSNS